MNEQHQQQVADDEPPIQVLLGDNYNLDYDESETAYAGDVFPGHLADGKLRYLQKMYKAVPEEYYTKTKKTPVTPRNARSWMKKQKTKSFHFWEMAQWLWTIVSSGTAFWTLCSLSHRLPVRLGSISS